MSIDRRMRCALFSLGFQPTSGIYITELVDMARIVFCSNSSTDTVDHYTGNQTQLVDMLSTKETSLSRLYNEAL